MASNEQNPPGSSGEDQPNDVQANGPLFYAYARRTDSYWASRYLLTFASVAIANEWWSLVQREYPDAGVRTSPQLFSFHGDKFPQKTANDKNFEHLTTKWFYSQIGDSDRTDGRMQDVVPVQDGEGNVLGGGSGSGGGEAVEKMMQKMQELMEDNASQIKTLAETQSKNNERFERMENLVEENATQIKALSEGDSANREHMKEVMQEHRDRLKALADGQAASAEWLQLALEQSTKASSEMTKELKRQRQQNKSQGGTATVNTTAAETRVDCPHDVHPPPRKIDKTIVGYDYGQKSVTGAKGKPAVNGK